jgi:Hydantoinase B/oxoprolinase
MLHVRAGHHADVGGITPGSMPPTSRTLVEEGAAIVSFKLVRGGAFQVRLSGVWGLWFIQCFLMHELSEGAAVVSFKLVRCGAIQLRLCRV